MFVNHSLPIIVAFHLSNKHAFLQQDMFIHITYVTVWRRPEERYAECYIMAGLGHHFSGWLYGFASHWQGRSNSCDVSRGSPPASCETFRKCRGSDLILVQDNSRAHTARVVVAYLDQEGIDVMDWLARSPGLNPIEHLGHAPSPPQSVQTLTEAGSDGGIECHRSGSHSPSDPEHA